MVYLERECLHCSPYLSLPAHLCRSYPCLGSIAMTAFLHASRFCASFGSSWCCFKSLRTLSIHLSLGLPRGLFPPTSIVVTCIATFVSSFLITLSCHERRFWVTYAVIGLTIASLRNFSLLIRSFLVVPWIQRSIFISVVCILCCSALCIAQHSLPYVKFGLMTVLYHTNFDIWQSVLGDTQSRAAKEAHNRDEHAKMDSGHNKERPNQKLIALSSSNNSFTLKKWHRYKENWRCLHIA